MNVNSANSFETERIERVKESGLFDPDWYLNQVPYDLDEQSEIAKHYIEKGAAEGLNPHPVFDTAYYLSQINHGEGLEGLTPLEHYQSHGWRLGRRGW